MFERRLKIVLVILFVVTVGLALRAAQLQVWEHKNWEELAAKAMQRSSQVETVRGQILDRKGRALALDEPCVDACIDYRALVRPVDERWVVALARKRLRDRLGPGYTDAPRSRQTELRNAEAQRIKDDLESMWGRLARVAGVPVEQIEETRASIVRKVDMRRRAVWYFNYNLAMRKHERQLKDPPPAWRRWLMGEDKPDAPQLDDFAVDVAEQFQDHPVLRAIDAQAQNELAKYADRYPGLALKPGTHRYYPYGDAACHVIGHLARVSQDEMKDSASGGELRKYYPNDLVGRNGVEATCEPTLRGTRGTRERVYVAGLAGANANEEPDAGTDGWKELPGQAPVPGKDVRLTIDVELQSRIQSAFAAVPMKDPDVLGENGQKLAVGETRAVPMHGAAVVIDVKSGEILALVSHPTYDLNTFDQEYERLAGDELALPLRNRATVAQLVPGSTAKPVVGLGAIADGLVRVNEGIECTGFLYLNGQRVTNGLRCWTQSMYGSMNVATAHHQIPWQDPHVGHDGNPDGFLTYADALQRSCNVYFETLGDRLKIEGLSKWFDRFGMGRPVGIGLPEAPGILPSRFKGDASQRQSTACYAAIGQGHIAATPIQMANVVTTIARGGVWQRPHLVAEGLPATWAPPGGGPDRVDLHLPREAIAAARDGMIRVVNTEGGTGKTARRTDMTVAAKTGTATAHPLKVKVLDKNGQPVKDENGKDVTEPLALSTHANPNARAPWYRGTGTDGGELDHAWYVGFAPAEDPQIAFAVVVEWGGGGGATAGLVAKELIQACVDLDYLKGRKTKDRPVEAAVAQ
jgi:penicillin-binding protein 2